MGSGNGSLLTIVRDSMIPLLYDVSETGRREYRNRMLPPVHVRSRLREHASGWLAARQLAVQCPWRPVPSCRCAVERARTALRVLPRRASAACPGLPDLRACLPTQVGLYSGRGKRTRCAKARDKRRLSPGYAAVPHRVRLFAAVASSCWRALGVPIGAAIGAPARRHDTPLSRQPRRCPRGRVEKDDRVPPPRESRCVLRSVCSLSHPTTHHGFGEASGRGARGGYLLHHDPAAAARPVCDGPGLWRPHHRCEFGARAPGSLRVRKVAADGTARLASAARPAARRGR